MSGTAPRIVLDSNVCLDLFAFKDPAVAPLLQALREGTIQAVADPACRDEWLRVIEYPKLGLDAAVREACRRDYDALFEPYTADAATPAVALPRCADPDDQKFLELAQAAQARWLLSRDHALLVLGRRTARAGLFEILTPRAWVALQALRAAAP
ncbi:putative toxin-antitoxin system toxin component, PIN family [Lysobacter sp. BMK333-48F3]|uniref:putative toxin-antitoxin system toxin component, PIN family n=1 Tax=Lysobacter sp. BMK333-48F3 TaxID=2867962 RepID=UPI001C8B451E|nr:putative toxin-antitoxin system toxin component, PIN family [Lysobacter sp. BMK333-48F3]MBX9399709.1 putative toxin-antitoxin system toxin component, PIN family [Lysobacter sp. BMK333-48F3]